MDPIRLIVVLVALLGVGAYALLAANSEREVDAGTAVGFLDDSGMPVDSAPEIQAAADPAAAGATLTLASEEDPAASSFPDPADKVELTEAQWREQLTSEQFYVLREAGTERPFTSPLDDIKRAGWFSCAGCDNLLFETKTKFDSRTGWPSFWQPVGAAHVIEEVEKSIFDSRIEVRCARCDGHLGHVFQDGPADKTGLRYCMNGIAMNFTPKDR